MGQLVQLQRQISYFDTFWQKACYDFAHSSKKSGMTIKKNKNNL